MRYASIKTCDLKNGTGLRVSLWLQGCKGYCGETCHNKDTWDCTKGKPFTDKEYEIIREEIFKTGQNLAITGGEPLEEYNIKELTIFLTRIKKEFNCLNIWLWTHFEWEEVKDLELMKHIDTLVTGKWIPELECDFRVTKNSADKWRGSCNQIIVDVPTSLKENKLIEKQL